MGITNRLQPDEVTTLCNTASEPNDKPGADGLTDIDRFARFIRATKAPAPDLQLESSAVPRMGVGVFERIGCATCHIESLTTAPAGNEDQRRDVHDSSRAGDGGLPPVQRLPDARHRDRGRDPAGDSGALWASRVRMMTDYLGKQNFESSRNKIRTAPLWGVRLRPRLQCTMAHRSRSATPSSDTRVKRATSRRASSDSIRTTRRRSFTSWNHCEGLDVRRLTFDVRRQTSVPAAVHIS